MTFIKSIRFNKIISRLKINKKYNIAALSLFIIAIFFRLKNLGYSNFQGDEISAQNFLFGELTFLEFLLTRQVGPGQYIVAYLANNINNLFNIKPELFVRLFFSTASLLSLLVTFNYSKKYLNKKVALIVLFFLSLSGLLISFSKFVQYQSFIILLSILAIFNIVDFLKYNKVKYLYISAIVSSIGFLFHYDALSFIFPILFLLILNRKYTIFLKYCLVILLIISVFYLPFILNPNFVDTFKYLILNRISSSPKLDSIYYSSKILQVYHSKEYLVSILSISMIIIYNLIKRQSNIYKLIFLVSSFSIALRLFFQDRNIYLVFISVVSCLLLFVQYLYKINKNRKIENHILIVNLWLGVSFITYGILVSKPLTHIYTIFIPMFLWMGIFSYKLISKNKFYALIIYFFLTLSFISSVSFNYVVFVDSKVEYPWNNKSYIFGKMSHKIDKNNQIDGIFGFLYNRKWNTIASEVKIIRTFFDIKTYSSNEKYRVTKYYIRDIKFKDNLDVDLYIQILKPQSLSEPFYINDKKFTQLSNDEVYKIYINNKFLD